MALIKIPKYALPGFYALIHLEDHQMDEFSTFLANMKVGTNPRTIESFLSKQLNVSQSSDIVQTLISFTDLLSPADVDYQLLSKSLTNSFCQQSETELSEGDIEKLNSNLFKIFRNSKNLKFTLKAFDLVRDDDFLFRDGKVFSDIRLVFNDDIEDKSRNAILIHRLLIDYYKDRDEKKISLLLDLEDLKKLKAVIERAIMKDEIVRKDYQSSINFLNLSDNV